MRWHGILISTGCLLVGLSTLAFGLGLVGLPVPEAEAQKKRDADTVWRQPTPGFQLQVIVDGSTLPQYYGQGRTYVEAQEGAEYELRIRNPLPDRVAVALAVDGLNTIDARHTSAWNASKWVIEPYGSITISGWQMSSERARRFYFTNERDSYAAKLGQTSNLGVITAVFFREKRSRPIPVTPPLEREDSKASGANAPSSESTRSSPKRREATKSNDDYAATGIGRSIRNDVWWVNMELEGQAAAEITVRYEYYSALLRLGVVPRYNPEPDPLRRREQSRGFSPEP